MAAIAINIVMEIAPSPLKNFQFSQSLLQNILSCTRLLILFVNLVLAEEASVNVQMRADDQ
jgi:hypothetical protein